MRTHLSIVTGASRGLGLAMCRQLLQEGHVVVAIARQPTELPAPSGSELLNWQHDLADPVAAARRLGSWLADCDASRWASVTLINNAGVVANPAPLADGADEELSRSLRVGLEAPTLLTAAFLTGLAIYPTYRATVKRVLFASDAALGWTFERKEHLAVFALAFAWAGFALVYSARAAHSGGSPGLHEQSRFLRLAQWAFLASTIVAIFACVVGGMVSLATGP